MRKRVALKIFGFRKGQYSALASGTPHVLQHSAASLHGQAPPGAPAVFLALSDLGHCLHSGRSTQEACGPPFGRDLHEVKFSQMSQAISLPHLPRSLNAGGLDLSFILHLLHFLHTWAFQTRPSGYISFISYRWDLHASLLLLLLHIIP